MKRIKLPVISALFMLIPSIMLAIPAKPRSFKITQPDGTELTIFKRGDENHHFYTTEDGYLISMNPDGIYHYVKINEDLSFTVSDIKANDITSRNNAEKNFLDNINQETQFSDLSKLRETKVNLLSSRSGLQKSAYAANSAIQKIKPPTTGIQRGIVILVEFQDVKFRSENAQNDFYRLLNEEGYSDNGAIGSARDYYVENSLGKFTPNFDVYGPITLGNDMAYYGGNDSSGDDLRPEEMVIEACTQLDDIINFADYDLNEDGYIDNVFLFYAGYGEADSGYNDTVWPHAWAVWFGAGKRYTFDGKKLDSYACTNEIDFDRNCMCGIGTFCHEYGHVLGLPDMYSTSYNGAFTPGEWELMDMGSYNGNGCIPPYLCAYSRYFLEWIEPTEINCQEEEFTLDVISKNEAYIIKTENEDEYFLLENRQFQGWDSCLPHHGMLIWHIDYDEYKWANNIVNNTVSHQNIDIEEADNNRAGPASTLRKGHTFPGSRNITSFTDDTTPGMLSWSGQRQGKPITNIREENELIHFNVYPEDYTANRSSSLKTDNLKIYSDSDNIYIINNDTEDIRFSVYNTMGISIKEGILSDNSQISINVTRGMYIIKCNDSTHKLNVR